MVSIPEEFMEKKVCFKKEVNTHTFLMVVSFLKSKKIFNMKTFFY